jgi:CDP-diacylglycerol--glycerol-3-phosphate 3-phosphatidyltransferase
MASVPVLIACVIIEEREIFTWLLMVALFSDILDGLFARLFRMCTEVGALLDSIADVLLTLVVIAGMFVFIRPILFMHAWGLGVIIGAYVLVLAFALLKYGQVAGFHNYLSRVAAYAQGIWIMSTLFWGFQSWAYIPMIAISLLSYIEEALMIAVLCRPLPDARGLPWVLRYRGNKRRMS